MTNWSPRSILAPFTQEILEHFYVALRPYEKENGAIELVIKPYDTYQTL